MYCDGPVILLSRTQKLVSLSSAEAGYISSAECTKDVSYLGQMLKSTRPGVQEGMATACEDNTGALVLANNPMGSARSKHVDIRHHFIRDVNNKGDLRTLHVE